MTVFVAEHAAHRRLTAAIRVIAFARTSSLTGRTPSRSLRRSPEGRWTAHVRMYPSPTTPLFRGTPRLVTSAG